MKKSQFIIIKNVIKKAECQSVFLLSLHLLYNILSLKILGIKLFTKIKFRVRIGYKLNLDNPRTFNEKIQWLKLNYFQQFYREACDKYLVRKYLVNKLGNDYEPKLIYVTQSLKDFSLDKIKEYPCIIKISNGSGQNLIVESKNQFVESKLKRKIKLMICEANMFAKYGCEFQYLQRNPYIVVERLLTDREGNLPNDYKLLYINGNLELIYCSLDRLGQNVRQLYDKNWNRIQGLLLENATKEKCDQYMHSKSIHPPKSLEKMCEIGEVLSKDFPLVRFDFYDLDGEMYFGEITLYHGGGYDRFYPQEMDKFLGDKIKLPDKNFSLCI